MDKAAATVDGVHTRNVTTAHTYKHTDHAVTHPLWRERAERETVSERGAGAGRGRGEPEGAGASERGGRGCRGGRGRG